MKTFTISIFIVLTLFTCHFVFAADTNDLVAFVNGENILYDKLDRLYKVQKNKLNQNDIQDKGYEKNLKEKLLGLMIDELLVLQEGKAKNIQISEEEISKRLDLVRQKQGGEEGLKDFLAKNNATLEDARNEIRNKLIYEHVKNEIINSTPDSVDPFKAFLRHQRLSSNIIIYHDRLLAKKPQDLQPVTPQDINLGAVEPAKDLSQKLQELRRRIDERRLTVK